MHVPLVTAHKLFARLSAVLPIPTKELERFVKFALVGAFGAVVDFTVLNLLAVGLDWPNLLANAVSFSCAVISNFTWNRLWTYPESRQIRKRKQLPRFALVSVIGLGINSVVLYLMDRFLLGRGLGEVPALNIAKAIAILVVLFWNFSVNRLWTYRQVV